MKFLRVSMLILVSAAACNVHAAAYWNDAAADRLWSNPANWTPVSDNRPPVSSDSAFIRYQDMAAGGQGPVIENGIDAFARNLSLEVGAGSLIEMTMTGGSLTLYHPGAVNIYFRLGAGSSTGKAVLNMSGGVLTVSQQDNGGGGLLRVGSGYGGEIRMSGDAVIDAFELSIDPTWGQVDIRHNAKMILGGDRRAAIETFIDAGTLTAWSGLGQIVCIFDAQADRTVITAAAPRIDEQPVGQTVPNPVIPRLADSGVMRYNGEYYIMGNQLEGGVMRSNNLVNWGPRTHVFSMQNDWAVGEAGQDREIHACDLRYVNGTFHLYWSVNRADIGVRHIGHAINTCGPMCTYTEPVTETWFADFIDPHLFIDDDGACYFYTVKFPHGNTIYGQPMADPWTLTGTDRRLLWLPSAGYPAWEWVDIERVNEAPFVIRYRDRYYMLYNANATWNPDYAIGCAESTSPLGFSNSDKYPYPVLARTTRNGRSITHIGQPSVVRGPNGFEWWLIYFARYDDGVKSQAVDRILFFDRTLHVAGPSSSLPEFSEGFYTPPPAAATLGDLFDRGAVLGDHWRIISGIWDVSDGEARQLDASDSYSTAIIESLPARHFLAEVNVKFSDVAPASGKAGLVAYYHDADNWMIVGLERNPGRWYYRKVEAGVSESMGYALPQDFNYDVYHNLRVTYNAGRFDVWIDERPAPGDPTIETGFSAAGLPGMYSQHTQAYFDGFLYTIGWDEYDHRITGWGDAEAGEPFAGQWQVGGGGIEATDTDAQSRIYKGDLLSEYEFMTQVTLQAAASGYSEQHRTGIYAVYTDAENWLKATVNATTGNIRVVGRADGIDTAYLDASVSAAGSFNLRVIRRRDGIRIFVDGALMTTVPDIWPPSQVGLIADRAAARFNGITQFKLGTRRGPIPAVQAPMSDTFDGNGIAPVWLQIALHKDDISRHYHNTLPNIVFHASNGRLQISGSEGGDDATPWHGRGLKYNMPIYGNSASDIDFDSFVSHSNHGVRRAAIGLRLQKDVYNWFEVRQTSDEDGDRLETVSFNDGVRAVWSMPFSAASGNLKVAYNNRDGMAKCYMNDVLFRSVPVPGLKDSDYSVIITAYTSNQNNYISCDIDRFRIRSAPGDFNNDWKADLADLLLFVNEWLHDDCDTTNNWCNRCDMNRDGRVDIGDLAEFAAFWDLDINVPGE